MNTQQNQTRSNWTTVINPLLFHPDPLGNNPGTDDGGRTRRPTVTPTLEDVTPDQYYPEDEDTDRTKEKKNKIVENDIAKSNEEKERIKEDYEPDDDLTLED